MHWLDHTSGAAADDPGAVLRGWRLDNGQTQVAVAAALGLTQQHLSQIENGQRPLSLEQRRKIVAELGIAAEDLGLSSGHTHRLVPREDTSSKIAASQLRWRNERRWLNQHRSELAQLAARLYPAEHRVPRTPLIAHPDWLPGEPIDLGALVLQLDEKPQTTAVSGSEPQSAFTRAAAHRRVTVRAVHLSG